MELDEFLQLDYKTVLSPIPEEDGGGWLAEIPELNGCCSDGATPEEALQNLKGAKAAWFRAVTKRGGNIPLPSGSQEEYSGKFTLRMPKSLHRRLATTAAAEGVSLNQYVLSLISGNFAMDQAMKQCSWRTPATIRQTVIRIDPSYRLEEHESRTPDPMAYASRIKESLGWRTVPRRPEIRG
ncbi:MAG: type II toxin-antitoxin system HicB family antitoxin [Firmicutes bacterium]|nr:type II toxin-antitoxin system HicB family antitoxin [Bacillota bacterium]